eukprot:1141414-Pelagomonas_calceolata.AAC.2
MYPWHTANTHTGTRIAVTIPERSLIPDTCLACFLVVAVSGNLLKSQPKNLQALILRGKAYFYLHGATDVWKSDKVDKQYCTRVFVCMVRPWMVHEVGSG